MYSRSSESKGTARRRQQTKAETDQGVEAALRRRRLAAAIRESLRELAIQLSLLNHQVGAQLDLRDVDLDCLDPFDRRAVVVRAVRDRYPDLLRLYAGMNRSMNQIYAGYDESELELLADFLQRTANAGRSATDELSDNQ